MKMKRSYPGSRNTTIIAVSLSLRAKCFGAAVPAGGRQEADSSRQRRTMATKHMPKVQMKFKCVPAKVQDDPKPIRSQCVGITVSEEVETGVGLAAGAGTGAGRSSVDVGERSQVNVRS